MRGRGKDPSQVPGVPFVAGSISVSAHLAANNSGTPGLSALIAGTVCAVVLNSVAVLSVLDEFIKRLANKSKRDSKLQVERSSRERE